MTDDTTPETRTPNPDVPDDAARLAREMVEKLTELVRLHPQSEYYKTCLRGWLAELVREGQRHE